MKPKLLIADKKKRIFDVPSLNAAGAKAGVFFSLKPSELIELPFGSELFALPGRYPVGYDATAKKFTVVKHAFAVSAFISPGYTATYSAAYIQNAKGKILPLFSYSPVCLYKGKFYVPAVKIDKDKRHDIRFMSLDKIKQNIKKFKPLFSSNRLFTHLIKCALVYNCPNGKNFFLQRYECPLPVSSECNARCAGCISFQTDRDCPATQPRINFTPTPEEIAQIALFHIENVKNPIVSFGQGCEGEPLLTADILLKSIKLIRLKTKKGIINLNTNASKSEIVKELFKAGLNSMRVSINSAQEKYYNAYYRPRGYSFKDVIKSIQYARKLKGFVSINYLTMPGFTDEVDEVKAMLKFLKNNDINMIQWRNLNYDPLTYKRLMKIETGNFIGIKQLMSLIKKCFPKIRFGYFNPSLPT